MGDASVALQEEDVRRIGDYMKPYVRELVTEFIPRPATAIETQLLERMVRIEEELKSQRELMSERFTSVDRRFEAVDRRFESVDKRFESVDKRFDDMQASFGRTQWLIRLGFALMTVAIAVFGLLG